MVNAADGVSISDSVLRKWIANQKSYLLKKLKKNLELVSFLGLTKDTLTAPNFQEALANLLKKKPKAFHVLKKISKGFMCLIFQGRKPSCAYSAMCLYFSIFGYIVQKMTKTDFLAKTIRQLATSIEHPHLRATFRAIKILSSC